MRLEDQDPEFSRAVEGQLSDGEELVVWCQCFFIYWGTRVSGWNNKSYNFVERLDWYWLSQTNINLRLGTWQAQDVGGFREKLVPVAQVAGVQTFAIRDILSHQVATGQPHFSLQYELKRIFGDWPETSPECDVTDMNLSFMNGETLSLCSPFNQFVEIAKNLDEIKSKAVGDVSDRATEKAAQFSVGDELGKLADLRDRGILSDEEFEQQKANLLKSD
jgi:hypothetical protein